MKSLRSDRMQGPTVSRRRSSSVLSRAQSTPVTVSSYPRVVVKQGYATQKGTVRKGNEDRLDIKINPNAAIGDPSCFAGVYDGHGGYPTAEWLQNQLYEIVQKYWKQGSSIKESTTDAYLQADKKLLTTKQGFMGMGERGVGGSKCGATAATCMIFQDKTSGTSKMVTANIGDARALLIRSSKGGAIAEQLTFDHVPDEESERKRIERFNPNPKMPLVRYVAGTWRVGGLLALSRAFGDAYMKGPLQFEGIPEGSDGYSSGFGVIAEPHITISDLSDDTEWVVISSDGLYSEEERGGGGGLDNQQVADICMAAGEADCNAIAQALADGAVEMGSTDDVTVVVLKLGRSS